MNPETVKQIYEFATKNGYALARKLENPPALSFAKTGVIVTVYYTTMSVSTTLFHPIKGNTKLVRKGVSMQVLEEIFRNPRTHTGQGVYEKPISVIPHFPIAFFRCVGCWKLFLAPTDKIVKVTVDGKIQKMCMDCVRKHTKKTIWQTLSESFSQKESS